MTTRGDLRRRTIGRGGPASGGKPPVEAGASLPERLLAARERKGVDLFRAERDTKIRAHYLAALERGDYRELPGAVYTKGFLRNYAVYLGLEPDDVLEQWRSERGDITAGGDAAIGLPRPIAARRPSFTFSIGLVVAAALALGVILFVGYLGFQLMRYNRPPAVAVTDPSSAVSTVEATATSYMLRGTSQAGATISITVAGSTQPVRTTASTSGTWSAAVELRRGANHFSVMATDPETHKQADNPIEIIITVPITQVVAPGLTVDQPAEGATFQNGGIPVQGSAPNATKVAVSAVPVKPTASPKAGASAAPVAPVAPAAVDVAADGSFSAPVELTAGTWTLTITATSADGRTTSVTRTVVVRYEGVSVVVDVKGGSAWMKVWVDGKLDPGVGPGKLYKDGKTLEFSGTSSVEVFTGSSGVTYFTVNGTSVGRLGKSGAPETWLFAPPAAPRLTNHR